MANRNQEDIRALFARFLDAGASEAAAEDIRAGERILDAHPAPAPDQELISYIKAQIAARLAQRRRRRLLYRAFAAAAAVIVVTAIALLGPRPAPSHAPTAAYASIIPTAIWESDDIAADDFELAYFNSEIQQIEAQMEALESGDGEVAPVESVEDIEMELIQIETDFWKG